MNDLMVKHRTVLYIEDNPANIELMTEVFESYLDNVELLVAARAKPGLELAHRHVPDLILLDVNLPDKQGHEVVAALRQTVVTSTVPIIAISSDANPQTIDTLMGLGVLEYLTKPFDIPELLKLVTAMLAPPTLARG